MRKDYYIRNNIIYVQGMVDGKRYRVSTKLPDTKKNINYIKKYARDELLKLVNKPKPKPKTHLKDFGKLVVESIEHKVEKSTYRNYQSLFRLHILPYFENFELKDIKVIDIENWQSKLLEKLSTSRVQKARILLKKILKKAYQNDLIEKNPFEFAEVVKMKNKKREIYTLEEMKIMIDNATGWLKTFLIVAFGTGMRTGELMALKWCDIDFENNLIQVKRSMRDGILKETTKTGNDRTITMLEFVKEELLKAPRKNEFLFVNKDNKPFSYSGSIIDYHFKPLLKRINVKYKSLYATRHTFATLMIREGVDIKWVQNMLGHSTAKMTLNVYAQYIKVTHKTLKIANNIMVS
jgi:integrase